MNFVAVKMLTGDRSKYVGLIFAISFASMLMAHQVSIFGNIMWRTTSQIQDVRDAEIWVMDPRLRFVDEIEPLSDNDLYRVRGVEGMEWAVRLYKGTTRMKSPEKAPVPLYVGQQLDVFLGGAKPGAPVTADSAVGGIAPVTAERPQTAQGPS